MPGGKSQIIIFFDILMTFSIGLVFARLSSPKYHIQTNGVKANKLNLIYWNAHIYFG
jgi:hypothetical protein